MELSFAAISLKSPDVYDPLQIFLQETGLPDIGILVYELIFSGAEFPYYAAHILFELPSTSACLPRKPVSPHHLGSTKMHQC